LLDWLLLHKLLHGLLNWRGGLFEIAEVAKSIVIIKVVKRIAVAHDWRRGHYRQINALESRHSKPLNLWDSEVSKGFQAPLRLDLHNLNQIQHEFLFVQKALFKD
jgi:hypothetical protein